MNARNIVVAACILFGGAVYGLHTEKMRVTTTCRDARLYMDGGIDANIESGGLNFHRNIEVYQKYGQSKLLIGNSDIVSEVSGAKSPVDTYAAANAKLTIFKNKKETAQGFPAALETRFGAEKMVVALNCRRH